MEHGWGMSAMGDLVREIVGTRPKRGQRSGPGQVTKRRLIEARDQIRREERDRESRPVHVADTRLHELSTLSGKAPSLDELRVLIRACGRIRGIDPARYLEAAQELAEELDGPFVTAPVGVSRVEHMAERLEDWVLPQFPVAPGEVVITLVVGHTAPLLPSAYARTLDARLQQRFLDRFEETSFLRPGLHVVTIRRSAPIANGRRSMERLSSGFRFVGSINQNSEMGKPVARFGVEVSDHGTIAFSVQTCRLRPAGRAKSGLSTEQIYEVFGRWVRGAFALAMLGHFHIGATGPAEVLLKVSGLTGSPPSTSRPATMRHREALPLLQSEYSGFGWPAYHDAGVRMSRAALEAFGVWPTGTEWDERVADGWTPRR